jgi:carbon-monoxide dehydrogenase medium subunit
MIPASFEYVRPSTIEEALEALADPEAKAIAGGHSLVPMMKLRLARPTLLVDLEGLALRGVREDGDAIRIGALTTYEELLALDGAVAVPDALRDCAATVGDLQVRNAGTLGGAIAHGDPASDVAAGVIALEATLRLRSATGVRECMADDFFIGPFTTRLEQQELLDEIVVERQRPGEGSAYVSIEDPASGYPLAGAAVRVRVEQGRLTSCTVGMTGVGAKPLRAAGIEDALLTGGDLHAALPEVAAAGGDVAYRRQLALVVTERAFASARRRAGGGVER